MKGKIEQGIDRQIEVALVVVRMLNRSVMLKWRDKPEGETLNLPVNLYYNAHLGS